jgi:hypothetical protein
MLAPKAAGSCVVSLRLAQMKRSLFLSRRLRSPFLYHLACPDYQRRRAKNLKKRAWTGVDYAFAKKQLEREPALCRKTFSEISEFNVYLSRSRACSYFSL